MFIYNVTVNIDDSVHDEWLEWMKQIHMKDVVKTGYFKESRICRVLGGEVSSGTTYAVQYSCDSMQHYEEYQKLCAPGLQQQHAEKYKDKFVAFRTLLEVIDYP